MTVDFVCIGAQKCATTLVAAAFDEHPGIQLPPHKELYYFAPVGEYGDGLHAEYVNFGKPLTWYFDQFVDDDRKKGEISTHYLFDPASAARIAEALPGVRPFAVLRDPVKRAWSHYQMEARLMAKEARPLEQILDEEPDNEILARGLYARQLPPFVDTFGDDLAVFLVDDLAADPGAWIARVYAHVGADPTFAPTSIHRRVNEAQSARLAALPRARAWARRRLETSPVRGVYTWLRGDRWVSRVLDVETRLNRATTAYPSLPDPLRDRLRAYYADDVAQLEALLGLRLEGWR